MGDEDDGMDGSGGRRASPWRMIVPQGGGHGGGDCSIIICPNPSFLAMSAKPIAK